MCFLFLTNCTFIFKLWLSFSKCKLDGKTGSSGSRNPYLRSASDIQIDWYNFFIRYVHISLRKLLISLELKYLFQWNGNIYFFGMEIQGVLAAGTCVEGLQVTSRSAGPPFYKMSHTELFISHKICLFFENILPSLKLQIKIL